MTSLTLDIKEKRQDSTKNAKRDSHGKAVVAILVMGLAKKKMEPIKYFSF